MLLKTEAKMKNHKQREKDLAFYYELQSCNCVWYALSYVIWVDKILKEKIP